MTAGGGWGKAGVRLDPKEREARRRKILADRNRGLVREWLQAENGYRLWRAGRLIPWRITLALDAIGADGPEVDIACLAQEPDVDHWELGIKYPTWEQTQALCRLTNCTVEFLCRDDPPMKASDTTMRFHVPAGVLEYLDRPRVMRFLPEAISANAEGGRYTPVASKPGDRDPNMPMLW